MTTADLICYWRDRRDNPLYSRRWSWQQWVNFGVVMGVASFLALGYFYLFEQLSKALMGPPLPWWQFIDWYPAFAVIIYPFIAYFAFLLTRSRFRKKRDLEELSFTRMSRDEVAFGLIAKSVRSALWSMVPFVASTIFIVGHNTRGGFYEDFYFDLYFFSCSFVVAGIVYILICSRRFIGEPDRPIKNLFRSLVEYGFIVSAGFIFMMAMNIVMQIVVRMGFLLIENWNFSRPLFHYVFHLLSLILVLSLSLRIILDGSKQAIGDRRQWIDAAAIVFLASNGAVEIYYHLWRDYLTHLARPSLLAFWQFIAVLCLFSMPLVVLKIIRLIFRKRLLGRGISHRFMGKVLILAYPAFIAVVCVEITRDAVGIALFWMALFVLYSQWRQTAFALGERCFRRIDPFRYQKTYWLAGAQDVSENLPQQTSGSLFSDTNLRRYALKCYILTLAAGLLLLAGFGVYCYSVAKNLVAWDVFHQYSGLWKGVFGFGTFICISIILPLLYIWLLSRKRADRRIILGQGRIFWTCFLLSLSCAALPSIQGMLACLLFPPVTSFYWFYDESLILISVVLTSVPIGLSVLLTMIPLKGRRWWMGFWIIVAMAFGFMPIHLLQPRSYEMAFIYEVVLLGLLMVLAYLAGVAYLCLHGIWWLGQRVHRLEMEDVVEDDLSTDER